MRNAFADELTNLADVDKDIVLLSGDIGNRMFDKYKEIAPNRFLNCGIAEANMMSIASGMALHGLRPVVYTITPFTTVRCLEQIKIGVGYHEAPVVIVGTGSGLSYAELGPTHHSLDDLAVIRTIPGINVQAPCDSRELRSQLKEALSGKVPTYIRIGKKGEPDLGGEKQRYGIGKAALLKDGHDLLIVGVGPILGEALAASTEASNHGYSVAVASLGGIKPLDAEFLRDMSGRFKYWMSLEEHGVTGGCGSSLLEWLAAEGINDVRLEIVGTPDSFIHELGNQEYTRRRLGLDSISLSQRCTELLGG